VADPGLAWVIQSQTASELAWAALLPYVAQYWQLMAHHMAPRHRAGRLKQWLNLLRRRYPEAQQAYEAVRTLNDAALVTQRLFGEAVLAS
jgi:tRNA-dihydrouridine synthase C